MTLISLPRPRRTPLKLTRGQRVGSGSHRIVDTLSQGGMGELYEVEDTVLERRAVMKVLHPRHIGRSDLAARLRDEARFLASCEGLAVPHVHETGQLADERPFFVMEKLRGQDLRNELTRFGTFSVPSAIALTQKLLAALSLVHQRGIVHRDLKLENVFVSPVGEVSIIDFGLARRDDVSLRRTGEGVALGTPRTMAPEQHLLCDSGVETDIYAVGLILFELVAGGGPFDDEGLDPRSLRYSHCRRPPPPPSRLAPQPIPASVDAIVLRALAKVPTDRFEDADEMASCLDLVSTFAPSRARLSTTRAFDLARCSHARLSFAAGTTRRDESLETAPFEDASSENAPHEEPTNDEAPTTELSRPRFTLESTPSWCDKTTEGGAEATFHLVDLPTPIAEAGWRTDPGTGSRRGAAALPLGSR